MLETWFTQIGLEQEGKVLSDESIERMLAQIEHSVRFQERSANDVLRGQLRRTFTIVSIAAMLLLVFGVAVYVSTRHSLSERSITTDVAPGGDEAILILSNGKRIVLNETPNGTIAQQTGIDIIKNKEGTIVYSINTMAQNQESMGSYNTIETPRGGQYQVVLPDGSTVWLNASSSLTFPIQFPAKERRIKITGEVYIDVSTQYYEADKKKRVPFVVETSTQSIEVLGTQFNVRDYPEEPETVTLVKGTVKLVHRKNGEQILLKPGQQAEINGHTRVAQADLEKALAWKNGDFIFKNEKLSNILQQVSRWYDIEITCPDHLASLEFNGMVSRKQPLSSIITMIESTGTVKVKRKERRAIVIE